MACQLILMWHAYGASRHQLELAQFLYKNHIDAMLLSEAHLTK